MFGCATVSLLAPALASPAVAKYVLPEP